MTNGRALLRDVLTAALVALLAGVAAACIVAVATGDVDGVGIEAGR